MFTGIIKDMGRVVSVQAGAGVKRFVIEADQLDLSMTEIGASIACNGCCLTAVEIWPKEKRFAVDVAAESLAITNLDEWEEGTRINLEASLKLGDELGGHMVSGHVDGLAKLISLTEDGDAYRLKIKVPDALARFIAPKGSVALNGISLTINEVEDTAEGTIFGVCIIPHTWAVTTLGQARVGDPLNIEVDQMARYVERYAARLNELGGKNAA